MAKQFLNGPDIVSTLQKMSGKAVTQCMHTDPLGDACSFRGLLNLFLQGAGVKVMSPHSFAPGINGEISRGEDPLPSPFLSRIGIFSFQRIR